MFVVAISCRAEHLDQEQEDTHPSGWWRLVAGDSALPGPLPGAIEWMLRILSNRKTIDVSCFARGQS